jgi:hypothetical protein
MFPKQLQIAENNRGIVRKVEQVAIEGILLRRMTDPFGAFSARSSTQWMTKSTTSARRTKEIKVRHSAHS